MPLDYVDRVIPATSGLSTGYPANTIRWLDFLRPLKVAK